MNSPEFANQREIHDELEDRRINLEPITTGDGDDSMYDEEYSEETAGQS